MGGRHEECRNPPDKGIHPNADPVGTGPITTKNPTRGRIRVRPIWVCPESRELTRLTTHHLARRLNASNPEVFRTERRRSTLRILAHFVVYYRSMAWKKLLWV